MVSVRPSGPGERGDVVMRLRAGAVRDGAGSQSAASDPTTIPYVEPPNLTGPPPQDRTYPVDQAIADETLPGARGGVGALTYTLTGPGGTATDPALPAGLSFDAASRVLSGTPVEATGVPVVLTYAATDTRGAAATAVFAVTIAPPDVTAPAAAVVAPSSHDGNRFDVIVRFSEDVDDFDDADDLTITGGTLADGASGITRTDASTYTARITPSPGMGDVTVLVPAGAAVDAAGHLSTASATATVAWSAATSLPADVFWSAELTVGRGDLQGQPVLGFGGPTTGSLSDDTFDLPGFVPRTEVTVGHLYWYLDGRLSFVFEPRFEFDREAWTLHVGAARRGFSGVPPSPDRFGMERFLFHGFFDGSPRPVEGAEVTVALSGAPPAVPLMLTAPENQTWTVGRDIGEVLLPEATFGPGGTSYALAVQGAGTLPSWLEWDADIRELTGTPDAATAGPVTLAFTASAGDESETVTFTIAVAAAPTLAAVEDQTWTAGTAIDTLELPQATGGTAPLEYTLTGTLPAGLTFDGSRDAADHHGHAGGGRGCGRADLRGRRRERRHRLGHLRRDRGGARHDRPDGGLGGAPRRHERAGRAHRRRHADLPGNVQ